MKTLLPCELSSQSPSLPFIRQFYVKQELCGLRRMETFVYLVSLVYMLGFQIILFFKKKV